MRSRYTAYALGEVAHLERTWDPRTRPSTIEVDPRLRWERLEVVDVVAGGVGDDEGVVEFRAHWASGSGATGQRGVLHERSGFTRRGGRWVYGRAHA